ncbi:hypothetical protein BC938DRAFT_474986 [Jimgerdemannia flammicorona]|uniref:Uncharacterized protein n=1 Tax=Jimgerdemannia flammicorona TaxID=994334 RepID=A0A433Q194_9FUNG|nr:hypothetical protein BC938DRAFT_474986 [Jimgerdemannia flammicorona]
MYFHNSIFLGLLEGSLEVINHGTYLRDSRKTGERHGAQLRGTRKLRQELNRSTKTMLKPSRPKIHLLIMWVNVGSVRDEDEGSEQEEDIAAVRLGEDVSRINGTLYDGDQDQDQDAEEARTRREVQETSNILSKKIQEHMQNLSQRSSAPCYYVTAKKCWTSRFRCRLQRKALRDRSTRVRYPINEAQEDFLPSVNNDVECEFSPRNFSQNGMLSLSEVTI